MTSEQRFVLDTNVVVSALLLPHSTPGQALHRARQAGVVLLSLATTDELRIVFQRPKFDKYVPLVDRMQFLATLIRDSTFVAVTERLQICRDPKDDKVLELAVNGSATYLVTGDQDLRALHPFRNIPIVSPGEFLELLG